MKEESHEQGQEHGFAWFPGEIAGKKAEGEDLGDLGREVSMLISEGLQWQPWRRERMIVGRNGRRGQRLEGDDEHD